MKIIQIFLVAFFAKSSICVDLECSFVNHFDGYNCEMVTNFNATSEISKVVGNHKYGKGDSDVQVFFINAQSNTQYVPSKVCKILKKIIKIDIFGKKIVEINRYIFDDCQRVKKVMIRHVSVSNISSDLLIDLLQLENFNLEYTNVESIPENFFKFNKKLKEVSMPNNKLQTILATLPSNLNTLILSNNPCIDMSFSGFSYRSTISLNTVLTEVTQKCKNGTTTNFGAETPEQMRINILEEKVIGFSEKFMELETKLENEADKVGKSLSDFQREVTASDRKLSTLRDGSLQNTVNDIRTKSQNMKSKIDEFNRKSDEIGKKVEKSAELRAESENLQSNVSRNKKLIIAMLVIQSTIIVYIVSILVYGKFYVKRSSKEHPSRSFNGTMSDHLISDEDLN